MSDPSHDLGATAWSAWDARWRTPEGRAPWLEPEPEVLALADELKRRGARRVLDLGCGVGRHAIHLTRQGFEVCALDAASAGLAHVRDWAQREALNVDVSHGEMTDLPYPDARFDAVIAWNVIYHGAPDVIVATVGEIRRVLRPGGLYLGTFLSTRHGRYGQGREVARDTFVIDDLEERSHPHHYCDAKGVIDFLSGFALWSLTDRPHDGPDTFHWHVLAERHAAT